MISSSSNGTTDDPWSTFFATLRQAIQAEAGLKVAEFIFPLLILDRLCSESQNDDKLILQEFLDVLNIDLKHDSMNETDRQKVSAQKKGNTERTFMDQNSYSSLC